MVLNATFNNISAISFTPNLVPFFYLLYVLEIVHYYDVCPFTIFFSGPSWSYGSWIYNYSCNHCLSFHHLSIEFEFWFSAYTSIVKKGPKYISENHRPIPLTWICCKLLDHIVVSSIMTHADTYNIHYHWLSYIRSREI
jgi:hypothetical protein